MKTLIQNLYTGAEGLKKAVCLMVLALYIGLTIYGGGALSEILMVAFVMVVYIYLPGKCWNMLLGATNHFQGIDFGVDILLGSGFFCAVYCVAMRLHIKLLLVTVPLAFAVLGLIMLIRI